MSPLTFYEPEIEKLCGDLYLVFPPISQNDEGKYWTALVSAVFTTPKYRFARAADVYYRWLSGKMSRNQKLAVALMQKPGGDKKAQ